MARCPIHGKPLTCAACIGAQGGKKGGKSTSPKKRRAAKKNAKLGGRPKA